jgi:hypothetical protein
MIYSPTYREGGAHGRERGIELFGSSAARHFRKLTEMVGFADALLLIASYTMV